MIPAKRIPYQIFSDRKAFRRWLHSHHASATELWLGFYKKGATEQAIKNDEAVEEALAFGWINGKVRRLNEEVYLQRFTPRKFNSIWSNLNKQRVAKLIRKKRMTKYGLEKVEAAKQNGSWNRIDKVDDIDHLAKDILDALKANPTAHSNFRRLTAAQRRHYIWWVEDAKRKETRRRRIKNLVQRAQRNIKPGM